MTESKRPHYEQRYSNRKSQGDKVSGRESGQKGKSEEKCCKPWLLGLIGFLALAAIIATVLLVVLNKPKD